MSRFSGEVMPSKSLAWRLVCLLGFASTICLSVRGQVWDFLGDAQIDGTRDHGRIPSAVNLRITQEIPNLPSYRQTNGTGKTQKTNQSPGKAFTWHHFSREPRH